MSKTQSTTVKVKILDREFQVACPEDEVDELNASAEELDRRMRTTQTSANIVGLERIAVMTALNITHEYLGIKGKSQEVESLAGGKLVELTKRLAKVIETQGAPALPTPASEFVKASPLNNPMIPNEYAMNACECS